MNILYLVRHAHAEWTLDENRPLSTHGCKDAIRVADILGDYPIVAIYSSPAKRARQTIMPLAERLDLPIHIESDLRERKLGNETFEDFFKAVEITWQDLSFAHPGGESSAEAKKRGIAVMHRLLEWNPAEDIVLSTHGNLMALILQGFNPAIDFSFWKSLSMPDIYKINFSHSDKVFIQKLWQDKL